ncbi:MAG: hypothetical protein KIT31_30520 [Deltaproteobacteria bacterium]|nr:hypothetical protein [Deltaproteobacteria bacterium]
MRAIATLVAIGIGLPGVAIAGPRATRFDGERPMMDPTREVKCVRDLEGKMWRIQCNDAKKVCLYVENEELDVDGRRAKPLERARACPILDESFDRAKYEARGYTMMPGRADAPYGWTRDERGRVFQVNFDLRKRLYLGVAYTPQKLLDRLEDPFQNKRSALDFGLLQFQWYLGGDAPTRHRFKLVEGQVRVEPFSSQVTIAHYDMSNRFLDPLLRITTFFGKPQRHDLHLNLGLWTEAGTLEMRDTPVGPAQLWKHATAQVTFDLWQSARLESFLRLRTGLGLEGARDDVNGYRSAITGASALELDCVLDNAGFHNVKLSIEHEIPRYFVPVQPDGTTKFAQRARAQFLYEAIVLAINDQPLTLKLAAGGEKRNDIPGVPDQWAFVMDAGLRFSLWAPPRTHF